MNPALFDITYHHPLLKKEDYQEIAKAHTRIDFREGETVLYIGKTAKEFYVIEDGLFRSFLNDYNGNEITTEFHCSGRY